MGSGGGTSGSSSNSSNSSSGGYTSIKDMFDGGGAGTSGSTFGGALGGISNAVGAKPLGSSNSSNSSNSSRSNAPTASIRPVARPGTTPAGSGYNTRTTTMNTPLSYMPGGVNDPFLTSKPSQAIAGMSNKGGSSGAFSPATGSDRDRGQSGQSTQSGQSGEGWGSFGQPQQPPAFQYQPNPNLIGQQPAEYSVDPYTMRSQASRLNAMPQSPYGYQPMQTSYGYQQPMQSPYGYQPMQYMQQQAPQQSPYGYQSGMGGKGGKGGQPASRGGKGGGYQQQQSPYAGGQSAMSGGLASMLGMFSR